ncbi:MAG TPA: hypothetical protein VK438_18135 [Xanthobacteraceae bacterium]|nr:hypothetical protein [Xanthobacteraceae bacterium]
MGRYFFSLSNGSRTIHDREGTELEGLSAVQDELIAFGLKVLKHRFSYGIEDPAQWSIEVMNEDHRVLSKLPLTKLKHLRRHAA